MKQILLHLRSEWYKYVLEVLVITLGVLGAYALNSWKNQNIEAKKEQLILIGLKNNMVFNIEEVDLRAINCSEAYYASLRLIELTKPGAIEYSNKEVDSLISVMINFATYDPTTGTIDEIINSGQLSLIQNTDLKDKLTNWSRLIIDAQKDATIAMDHLFSYLLPYLAQKANLSNVPQPDNILKAADLRRVPPSSFSANYDELMTSLEFESLTSIHALNLMYMVGEYRKVQLYMEDMLSLIESDIKEDG